MRSKVLNLLGKQRKIYWESLLKKIRNGVYTGCIENEWRIMK